MDKLSGRSFFVGLVKSLPAPVKTPKVLIAYTTQGHPEALSPGSDDGGYDRVTVTCSLWWVERLDSRSGVPVDRFHRARAFPRIA